MMWLIRSIIAMALLLIPRPCLGVPREGFGPGLQDWGFVDVRPGAHMFYWLYYTTAEVEQYTERPLVIWLQGGPGTSSLYGNFEELGPLTLELDEREHTWVKNYNVLFIDSPVGTGFSYVDDLELLTKTSSDVARDLVTFAKEFYRRNFEFKDTPLHIYAEHYGGKMAAEFAWALNNAFKNGEIDVRLHSIGLIAPWISPLDSVLSYGPYLLNMGFVDTEAYIAIHAAAIETEHIMNLGRFEDATFQWGRTQHILLRNTGPVSWYNALLPFSPSDSHGRLAMSENGMTPIIEDAARRLAPEDREQMLRVLMRESIASALQLPTEAIFDSQGAFVFNSTIGDFMKPALNAVELLLNGTDIAVVVVIGQLDLLVTTPGTIRWVEKLRWEGRDQFLETSRDTVGRNGIVEGYEKSHENLHVYWALRAGHMVPADNPPLMEHVLEKHVTYL